VRDTAREILAEPTLAVMVPFDRKLGNWLNGYRIGTYLAERITKHGTTHVAKDATPAGFLEVREQLLDLPLTRHLKLADFVTHDDQDHVWPKYVALNPRLLDKLELILADLGSKARPELSIDVHSGFRSPSHNHETRHAARDSRHQYGDAADIQIDADGDGRMHDARRDSRHAGRGARGARPPRPRGRHGDLHLAALPGRRTCTSMRAGRSRGGTADAVGSKPSSDKPSLIVSGMASRNFAT